MFKLLATIAALMTQHTPPPELRGEALMETLRAGGYTIVLRHARTDHSFKEDIGAVPASRAMQRNLNDDGVRDARLMGVAFKKYGIPFSDVIASPMFRATETAEYAVRQARTTLVLRTYPTLDDARALIAERPAASTNRLIVTHHFVIEAHVPGIKAGAIAESEAAIVRTTADGKIELVGRILLADWATLAAGTTSTTSSTPQGHGAPPAHAAPSGPANFSNTTLSRLAQGYLHAFSSGDTATMHRFIDVSLEVDPKRTTADRHASYARLFANVGTLSNVTIDSAGDHEITVTARAMRGTVQITVKESEQQPERAASMSLRVEGQ